MEDRTETTMFPWAAISMRLLPRDEMIRTDDLRYNAIAIRRPQGIQRMDFQCLTSADHFLQEVAAVEVAVGEVQVVVPVAAPDTGNLVSVLKAYRECVCLFC